MGVNPLAQRAQGLRGQPFGQLARVAGLRRAAVQQAVNVGLLVIGLAGYQLLRFSRQVVSASSKRGKLEGFDQVKLITL